MKLHVDTLPPPQITNTFVGVDIEMWNQEDGKLHWTDRGQFACMSIAIKDDIYIIVHSELVPMALARIDNCIWAIHNAKYDINQLRRWATIPPRTRLWDTMIVERIMYNGLYSTNSGYGLNDLVRRWIGEYRDKSLQKSFSDGNGELSQEQIQYAAQDAHDHLNVALSQSRAIDVVDFKIWKNLEAPTIFSSLDFKGFPFDPDLWAEHAKASACLAEEFQGKYEFNLNSPGKRGAVSKYVQETYDIELSGNTQDAFLQLMESHAGTEAGEFAKFMLEYKECSSWASKWGLDFLDHVQIDPQLGPVIRADFWTIGADSGRMSASNPPLHNIPIRPTPLGTIPPHRGAFRAPDGMDLIRADFPSQEPRIIAYVSGDKKLLGLFQGGDDPYLALSEIFYGYRIEKTDPRRSSHMKPCFLGAGYGLTPGGMSKKYGLPLSESIHVLETMFDAFPVLRDYVESQKQNYSVVKTLTGRKHWLNPYDDYHRENEALNAPIQGTGADMIKMALNRLHKLYPNDYPVIMPHHDEIIAIAPCDISQDVANAIGEAMTWAGEYLTKGEVPFPVTPKLVKSWLEDK